jgi:hypothetical protein
MGVGNYTLSLAAKNVSVHTPSSSAVAVVAVVAVVVDELEQNLSSDFQHCLVTPKNVKTYRHNRTPNTICA